MPATVNPPSSPPSPPPPSVGADNNRAALSLCGKIIVTLLGAATIILCMGMLGTILAPELPSVSLVSAAAGDLHGCPIDVALSFTNPNGKDLSYTNVTLTTYSYYYYFNNDHHERISTAASVAAPPFEQGRGGSRTVRFRVRGPQKGPSSSEVEIEFRARVRYGGKSWPAKPESDVRAKCKRVKVSLLLGHENGNGISAAAATENPNNCSVEGLWRTARMVMLGSTLVLPFLVVVFLSFNGCCYSFSDNSQR